MVLEVDLVVALVVVMVVMLVAMLELLLVVNTAQLDHLLPNQSKIHSSVKAE